MKKSGLFRKVVACVSSLALAGALVPATALTAVADDTVSEDAAFTIYACDASTSETTTVASYTEQELSDMSNNYYTLSYAYNKGVYSTANYVYLDDLLDGVEQWTDGSYIQFECSDGTYTKYTHYYEDAQEDAYFYPNAVVSDASTPTLTLSSKSATVVPDVIALSYASTSYTEGSTLMDLESVEGAETDYRFFSGVASDSTDGYNYGRMSPSGVLGMTIYYNNESTDDSTEGSTDDTVADDTAADDSTSGTVDTTDAAFVVYAQESGSSESTAVAAYTEQELSDMSNNYPTLSYAYSMGVCSTANYVYLDDLLDGVEQWTDGSYIQFECSDGTYTKYTHDYATAQADAYFYPNAVVNDDASSLTLSSKSVTAVPDVIALTYQTTSFSAGSTLMDLIDTSDATSDYRFFCGVDADSTDGYNYGRMSPSGVLGMTVVYESASSDESTGSDSTVGSSSSDSSTSSATTATAKKVSKKAQKMKVTKKNKTVKAKKLKKKAQKVKAITVKNYKGKLSFKKVSGSKRLSLVKGGRIKVKRGTKKGTYKIKVKVTAKGNSTYKSASKTVTVKIKVK